MAYTNEQATRAALTQADRYKAEAARLKNAIVLHYKQIHQHNWGQDDELWAEVGLVADPDVVG